MKKILLLTIAIFIIMPGQSFAYTVTGEISNVDVYYDPSRDVTFINYSYTGFANGIHVLFSTNSNTIYTRDWPEDSVNKTIWVTCNGTYNFYLKVNGQTVASIENVVSTEIQTNYCVARAPGSNDYDLNLRDNPDTDGSNDIRLDYDDIPGTDNDTRYELDRSWDGGLTWNNVDTNFGNDGHFKVTKPGDYRLTVIDGNGDIVSRDIIGEGEFNNSKCNGCKSLSEMLACPAWEQYLGDLRDTITDALPPPPDIEAGNDDLIEKIADQDVTPEQPVAPEPYDPGYPDQELDLPEVIESDLNPEPTDYELEVGGDGAGKVNITDPAAWIPSNTDIGYEPPDPDSDTPPAYDPVQPQPETPPAYDPVETQPDTPPGYDYTDNSGEQMPNYDAGENEDMPNYENPNDPGGTIPGYEYN